MEYQIVISGTIGTWWSSVSPDYVRYILRNNKDKEVHVGFCSPGGSVAHGLEMYQAFKDHGNVHAHAFGMNASISTIAMLGCKSIDIVKGSFFLIHNASYFIDKFEQSNKERIDEMIAQLKKQREELETIDDVLAQLYADKCGKTLDEIKAQMKKGTWMSAQQALDFGLVDSIREDEREAKNAVAFCDDFFQNNSNISYLQDAGIQPPVSTDDRSIAATSAIADNDGNPTPNFIQKTWNALQNLLSNQQASTEKQNSMIKIFASVMALLACADGFKPQEDGTIALTQDQMKTIDDQLSANKKALDDKEAERKTLADKVEEMQNKVAQLEKDLKAKDEQITALKGSAPEDKSEEKPVENAETFNMADVFNAVNN